MTEGHCTVLLVWQSKRNDRVYLPAEGRVDSAERSPHRANLARSSERVNL
jgi:hypothetical protein